MCLKLNHKLRLEINIPLSHLLTCSFNPLVLELHQTEDKTGVEGSIEMDDSKESHFIHPIVLILLALFYVQRVVRNFTQSGNNIIDWSFRRNAVLSWFVSTNLEFESKTRNVWAGHINVSVLQRWQGNADGAGDDSDAHRMANERPEWETWMSVEVHHWRAASVQKKLGLTSSIRGEAYKIWEREGRRDEEKRQVLQGSKRALQAVSCRGRTKRQQQQQLQLCCAIFSLIKRY